MCGVFGFVSTTGGLCVRTIRQLASDNQQRGGDAWGMAWIDSEGELQMYKTTGPVRDMLGVLSLATGAKILIGHTRYATQGDPAVNDNNHPHQASGGFIVHNGMIPEYRQVIREYGLETTTQCDSEVLARLIERFPDEQLVRRCISAARIATDNPLVMLGLWKPGVMVAVRRRNPLWVGTTKRGRYFSSIPNNLPGAVAEFENNKAVTFQAPQTL